MLIVGWTLRVVLGVVERGCCPNECTRRGAACARAAAGGPLSFCCSVSPLGESLVAGFAQVWPVLQSAMMSLVAETVAAVSTDCQVY